MHLTSDNLTLQKERRQNVLTLEEPSMGLQDGVRVDQGSVDSSLRKTPETVLDSLSL